MKDPRFLKLHVDDYEKLEQLIEDQGDYSGEHLTHKEGPFGVVWMDCTRPEDPPGTHAKTGLPGCLETTLPIANRIRDCVNACVGIIDPIELRKQRDELFALCEEMFFLLGVDSSSEYNRNAIRRAKKQFDRISKIIEHDPDS